VSRKITKYVSVPQVEESESIEEISRNFVQNAITKFEEYRPDLILNTDQSGFTYLEHSSHTLAIKGQKKLLQPSHPLVLRATHILFNLLYP
jgi:hypothetical protein